MSAGSIVAIVLGSVFGFYFLFFTLIILMAVGTVYQLANGFSELSGCEWVTTTNPDGSTTYECASE